MTNGITYASYKNATRALNLLEDDDGLDGCLNDASNLQMSKQIMSIFVFLCDHLMFWNK